MLNKLPLLSKHSLKFLDTLSFSCKHMVMRLSGQGLEIANSIVKGNPIKVMDYPSFGQSRLKLLDDEETFNLGFATAYKADSPELLAYSQGVIDGAKAQLEKIKGELE